MTMTTVIAELHGNPSGKRRNGDCCSASIGLDARKGIRRRLVAFERPAPRSVQNIAGVCSSYKSPCLRVPTSRRIATSAAASTKSSGT